jgi:hyperosmotically inducible protein
VTNPIDARRGKVSILLLVGTSAVLAACSTTEPVKTQISDDIITSKVKAKLAADPEVNPFEIDVDTQEGVVRLSGWVDKSSQRTEAEKLTRQTKGVRSVENELEVGPKSFGQTIDDGVIVTKVKAKIMANVDLNPFNIDVDSEKGVVTLSGRVASQEQKDMAGKLARETKGVVAIHNRLKVGKR